ncbi:hypothetical protein [Janibacter corallicola]|uniref:hypothetical protein n=1 Tax=Janibacter corallicola TaxID=415212 RepID=UPI000ACA3558|nr:hypothetical protein [Janibacter corallicola]
MPLTPTRTIAPIATGALTLCLAAIPVAAAPTHAAPANATSAQAAPASPSQGKGGTYQGEVEVVPGPDADQQTLDGVVFEDRNQNVASAGSRA